MKDNIKIILSLALVLAGLIGTLVCIIPSASSEYKIVEKYINSIDACNENAVKACTAIDEYSQIFGIDTSNDLSLGDDANKYDYLKASNLSIKNSVPKDVKEVKKISLISCDKKSSGMENLFSSTGTEVYGVIRVVYETEDNESVSIVDSQSFTLAKTSKGYKIVG